MAIWKIGVAHKRIEELESQVATLTKERDEAKEALVSNDTEASTAAEQLQKDLANAQQNIAALNDQNRGLATQISTRDTEIAALNAKLAAKDGEVKIQVAQQVANTQAALGQPPVTAAPAGAKSANTTLTGRERIAASAKANLEAGGFTFQN